MANTLITPTAVTREALRVLHQKLNFISSIVHDYDDRFAKEGAKIGDTLKIRLPNEYVVRSGAALSAQDTVEQTVDLKVQTQKGVDLNFTSVDLTLSLDKFSERIIEPAMAVLAANIEADAMSMALDIPYSVWNGGSAMTLAKAYAARKILNDNLAPMSKRTGNLNSQDTVDFLADVKGLFNAQETLSKQYVEGQIGRTAGIDFVENTLWPAFTRGSGTTAYLVNNAAVASGDSTMPVDTGTGAVKKGDVFTFAGVYRVHPESKLSTGILQQFVLTADATSGANTWSFAPSLVSTGARQNVSALPADNAAITFFGTLGTAVGTSLIYQREAFAFATADLEMPKGVDFSAREVYDGISMRIVRQYDITQDKFPCRLDVLYGYKTTRHKLAVRSHNN